MNMLIKPIWDLFLGRLYAYRYMGLVPDERKTRIHTCIHLSTPSCWFMTCQLCSIEYIVNVNIDMD
jgi:hypothetical protein